MELYTVQIAKGDFASEMLIPVYDITVKSGDKLFAPDWSTLMEYKKGQDEALYRRRFTTLMRSSYQRNKQHWINFCNRDKVAIACYCGAGEFCHRKIMVDYFSKVCNHNGIPFNYMGEITQFKRINI